MNSCCKAGRLGRYFSGRKCDFNGQRAADNEDGRDEGCYAAHDNLKCALLGHSSVSNARHFLTNFMVPDVHTYDGSLSHPIGHSTCLTARNGAREKGWKRSLVQRWELNEKSPKFDPKLGVENLKKGFNNIKSESTQRKALGLSAQ
jgi:hypothetical protein